MTLTNNQRQEIQLTLTRLASEVDARTIPDDQLERLHTVVKELETALEETSCTDGSTTEHFLRRLEEFEIEHPRATAILNDLMVTLSGFGV